MGRPVELSAEQLRAIRTPGNLFVRAGAGSGKTEVLARRFVAIVAGDIEDGTATSGAIDPESIAAVTFSEKAAYDMRQRITAVLAERIAQAPDAGERQRLLRARRSLPLARIMTLHAFCARILKENALAAGLDPAFEVIDEYESAVFLERECEKALLAELRTDDAGALHLTAARRLRGSAYREGALQIVLRIISELQRAGLSTQWLADRAQDNAAAAAAAESVAVNRIALAIVELIDGLVAAAGLTGAAAAAVEELRSRWQELRPTIAAFTADTPPSALSMLRELLSMLPAARGDKIKNSVNKIRELISTANTRLGLGGQLIESWGSYRAAGPTLDVAHLLTRIAATIEAAKRANAVVTFDDLLLLARSLLHDNPAVVKRYQQSLRAILVDEFQDTDPIQDEIIARLCEPAAAPASPSLFIVGDEKQSIYRFRGADVAVFNARRQAGVQVLPLRDNRRSTPNVVGFVNALAASIMRSESDPPPPYCVQWTEDHELAAVRDRKFNPPVEILGAIECKTLRAGRKLEAAAIANRITTMIAEDVTVLDSANQAERPARYGDIAILMRAFTDVAIYERALRAAGIPCYTVKGRGLFGCQEIIDLCELLTAVNDPANSLALAAALRSPFFSLSDDCLLEIALYLREKAESGGAGPANLAAVFATAAQPDFAWLERERAEALAAWRVLHELRSARERLPITALIVLALERTGFEAVMLVADPSRQRAANLRRLLELARAFEAHQLFTFHDFVAYLRRLIAEEPREPQAQILSENENVVRLMTVHQAKGLEFPIVIVADMTRAAKPVNETLLLSRTGGLILCDTAGAGYDEIPNHRLAAERKAILAQEAAESARILYVAITRARDRL
ncbi:MAG: UvrD-helicase domain-containing protein, partial [Candidatus Binataceae bacterium]